jgi:hypothetical protein
VVSVLIAAIVGFLIEQVRRSTTDSTVTYVALVVRLALLQLVTFIGVEASERLIHDASLTGLAEPVVSIGVLFQVVGACVAALVLFAIGRAVDLVIRSRRRGARRARAVTPPRPAMVAVRRFVLASGGPTLRGPPALA